MLKSADIVQEQFHYLTLRPKGLEMHEKLVELYLPKVAKQAGAAVGAQAKKTFEKTGKSFVEQFAKPDHL